MKLFCKILSAACTASLAAPCCLSCINVDDTLGQDYIPDSHIWKVEYVSFDLADIEMRASYELGGYSSRRLCVGGVEDPASGWSEHEAAFSLIPIADTSDFTVGENPEFLEFHFAVAKDSVSVREESQTGIIQSIRVYELKQPLDEKVLYAGKSYPDLYDRSEGVITEGVPTYHGGDSLSFNFNRAFGEKYLAALQDMKLDTVSSYIRKLPGICITADRPMAGSGRINMFKVAVSVNDYNYLTGNYAELKFRSTFDERGAIDTSIVFMIGAADFIGSESASLPSQYAFNLCKSEGKISEGAAGEEMYIEGGCGLKPVLRAAKLKEAVAEAIGNSIRESLSKSDESFKDKSEAEKDDAVRRIMGDDESEGRLVINRATVKFPYLTSAGYEETAHYPVILSPTCRLIDSTTVNGVKYEVISFAGLTDASVSSENQGDINRSLNCYSPDISHHIQELLRLKPKDAESEKDYAKRMSQYDIWFLILHSETNETSSSSSSSYNDYLSALAYSSYYNSLYNGYGYGGYGYGSYGYSSYYNNYYNYMMMAAYASSSSSTSTSTSTELDKDRYYNCRLYGPASTVKRPCVTITYSYPTEE